jgi:UPF0716 protein FxsA
LLDWTINDPGPRANLANSGFGPMSLVKWVLIGVILLPVAEIVVFIIAGLTIGWLPTAALFLATSVAGLMVLKHQGRGDLDRFRAAVRTGGLRAINLDTPGLAPIMGGILLVLPGFITDALGALLFVPPIRGWVRATIGRALRKRRAARDPSVIDLTPEEWHQVSDAIEDGRERKRSSPRKRNR